MKFDTIVIGGGRSGLEAALEALDAGGTCAIVTFGRSTGGVDYRPFTAAGGTLLLGDKVTGAEWDGPRIASLRTANLGSTPLEADNYVLATGKFSGGGLYADMDSVRETVFGLDVRYEEDRSKWFDPDFFARQPFLDFGVATDPDGHPFAGGVKVPNLVAVGRVKASGEYAGK